MSQLLDRPLKTRIALVPTRYFERMVHTPLLKVFDQENVPSEGQCDIVLPTDRPSH